MPQVRKKILVVTNMYPTKEKPQWGMFVYEQVKALQNRYSELLDVDVYHIDGSLTKTAYLKAMLFLPFFTRKNYHLVHVHYGLTLIATVFVPVPVIATFHGSDLLKKPVRYISKICSLKAKKSIVVSKELRRVLGKGTIIPCGINTDVFRIPAKHVEREKKNSKDTIKIMFPSDPYIEVKNYPLFKKVCEILREEGKAIEEVYLKNIPRENVPDLFWKCDLMLLTSFFEGSPTVIKEAIAAKLPFISVDVGDVHQWVQLINFGVVVQSGKPADIAREANRLIENKKDRTKLDNRRALEKIDINNISSEIYRIYKSAIK